MDTQQRRYQREYLRKRKAEDPDFRSKRAARQRAYRAVHGDRLNALKRQRYATDLEFRTRIKASNTQHARRYKLMHRYGMSLEEFGLRLEQQQGVCAICRRTFDKLCIDHCHHTGKLRGLLCHGCNAGLGFYEDNPAFMIRSAAYLRYWARKHAES